MDSASVRDSVAEPQAAVDHHGLPGDPRRGIRGQKHDSRSDVVGFADPVQRDGRRELLLVLLPQPLSYRDAIDFGIVSTPEMTPDIWNLIDYLADELDELHAVD
jgi:hypothetical protein